MPINEWGMITMDNNWIVTGASSIGKSHIDRQKPNQDAFTIRQDEILGITACVVCDGAGSAKYSEQGSKHFSEHIIQLLMALGNQLYNKHLENIQPSLTKNLIIHIEKAKQKLASKIAEYDSLRDYHTTIVGVLLLHQQQKALVLQIGDSNIITSRFALVNNQVDYFVDVDIPTTDSASSEYVNETHFVTQDDWVNHLQLRWLDLSMVDLIALMTDGCGDLVVEGGKVPKRIYRPFFANLIYNVLSAESIPQTESIIHEAIANPATYRLTGDDKTLILLIKKQAMRFQGIEPILTDSQDNNNNQQILISSWQASTNKPNLIKEELTESISSQQPLTSTDNLNNHLPPVIPIQKNDIMPSADDSNKKKRQKIATLSVLGLLVGAGAVAVGYKDWIMTNLKLSKTSSEELIVNNQKNPIKESVLVKKSSLTPYDIATTLTVNNLQQTTSELRVIVAFVNGQVQQPINKPVNVAVLNHDKHLYSVMAEVKSWKNLDKNDTLLHDSGIVIQQDWQYVDGVITLKGLDNTQKAVDLPKEVKEVILPDGLVSLFKKSNNADEIEDLEKIKIYYLSELQQVSDKKAVMIDNQQNLAPTSH